MKEKNKSQAFHVSAATFLAPPSLFNTLPQHQLLGRKNIPADRAAFQVLEELVLHSFEARVVSLPYTHLGQHGTDISEQDDIGQAISRYEC